MFMSPQARDGLDMVRLEYFGAGMETEVVRGLLEANGIPATLVGQYDYANKSGHRGVVMVPRERLEEAHQIIREARGTDVESSSPPDLRMPWWLRIAFATPILLLLWNLLQAERVWTRMLDWFR